MKLFLLILIITLPSMSIFGQWKKTNSPTIQDLYDIQVMGKTGYIAGQGSTVLKSTDSGRSWKSISIPVATHLRSLYFMDSLTGIVTGENARMLKTTDGGKSWVQKYARIAAFTHDVTFSGKYGIAVGKDMLAIQSMDFGETWQVDTTFTSNKKLNSICILPDRNCWAVGDSGWMLHKKLGDHKWNITPTSSRIDLNHISNIGDSVLLIAGGMTDSTQIGVHLNIFMRSLDGGKTWQTTTIPEMKTILTAYFHSKDSGFLAGSNGIISKSYDPFNKRGQQLSGSASLLNKLFFDHNTGWIVGDGGTILRTTNNGGFGLSLNPVNKQQAITLFPNPNTGSFRISGVEHVNSVMICDATGRLLATYSAANSDFSLPGKGLYMVVFRMNDGSLVSQQVSVQ